MGLEIIVSFEKGIILPSATVERIALLAGLMWAMSMTLFNLANTTSGVEKTSLTAFLIPFVYLFLCFIPGGRNLAIPYSLLNIHPIYIWMILFAIIWLLPSILLTYFSVEVLDPGRINILLAFDMLAYNDMFSPFRYETSPYCGFPYPVSSQTFSITAADFDLDGDLDIYACGYNPSADRVRSGTLGEPLPYHDAQNGGRNMLLRNEGGWQFNDVTETVGLSHNNNRFSFAAAWEDYDDDGDPDLYVANDYGRNNPYQNTNGRFVDVAAELGIEDMSAGMSASWGDFNRDGRLDIYISNMFSAAGNRITFQRQFKPGAPKTMLAQYQRHARGNSLFQADLDGGGFSDVSVEQGVTMGRWAWGSRFVDLNNDGWEDLVVANGFISTEDTGDL